MNQDWINALIGGILIGVSVSLMLLFNGRVTGVSGILNGVLKPVKGDTLWRVLFVLGLVLGGVVMGQWNPKVFESSVESGAWQTLVAGLLVGFGTTLGSGCTSGHGVCGISRLSLRSLVATLVFMAAGIGAVFFFRQLGVY